MLTSPSVPEDPAVFVTEAGPTTAVIAADASTGSFEPQATTSLPYRPSGADTGLPSLERTYTEVFETLCAQGQPLTARQIVRLANLSESEVREAVDALRALRLVRRLNTVIESYVAGRTIPRLAPDSH
jgi:hypothetical protein